MELYNADCLVKLKDLSANSVDCVILDLPYGTTNCAWDTKIDLAKLWEQLLRVGKERTAYFLFCDFKLGVELVNSNPKMYKQDLVWDKQVASNPLIALKRIRTSHENILVFYKKPPVFQWAKYHTIIDKNEKMRNPMDNGCFVTEKGVIPKKYEPKLPVSVMKHEEQEWVGCLPNDKMLGHCGNTYEPRLPVSVMTYIGLKGKKRKHPTEKPIPLLEHLIKYYTADDAVVLDPTMGSGTTGQACKNLGRRFIGIEMDKAIYDIAVERLATEEEKTDTI